jgi:hypothetical protein
MREATEGFLARLHDEAARILGPGVELDPLAIDERSDGVRLRVGWRAWGEAGTIEVDGSDELDAGARLLARLPEERLALGLRTLSSTRG